MVLRGRESMLSRPGKRKQERVMRVFAAALVGILGVTVLALPAEAAESVGSSVTVSGPCTSAADYRVILRDEGTTGRVRLMVSNAAPGSRWRVSIRDARANSGTEVVTQVRASSQGRLGLAHGLGRGQHRLRARAVSAAGQECLVRVRAAI